MMLLNTNLTQISRKDVSRPIRWIVSHRPDLIVGQRVLNFGEGKAYLDTLILSQISGHTAGGYDPNTPYSHSMTYLPPPGQFDVCVAVYVLNVLPPDERREAILDMMEVAPKAIVAVRADEVKGTPYLDGVVTSRNTFQKSFDLFGLADDFVNAGLQPAVVALNSQFIIMEASRK